MSDILEEKIYGTPKTSAKRTVEPTIQQVEMNGKTYYRVEVRVNDDVPCKGGTIVIKVDNVEYVRKSFVGQQDTLPSYYLLVSPDANSIFITVTFIEYAYDWTEWTQNTLATGGFFNAQFFSEHTTSTSYRYRLSSPTLPTSPLVK